MENLQLPQSPAGLTGPVKAWWQDVVVPTYQPAPADRNPMFLEKRVYQGSSGRVYPLPYIDRIAEEKTDQSWRAVHIENEFLRLMILPELGGRIHIGLDKTNGYDFFYRQNVIKPALVGLAGPWISGGVEFNWPQHHRPSTFMPVDVHIEHHTDGSVTVWCSEHEPMNRMKGMHGVCLHPGKSIIELKVRIYNRTPLTQTFLWWANVATRVHEQYQSFFPPDVSYVADHAKRATSRFPLCAGSYYGVDYGKRGREGVSALEMPASFVPLTGAVPIPSSGIPGEGEGGGCTLKGSSDPRPNPPPAYRGRGKEGHISGTRSSLSYAANDLSWYANIPVPTSYMAMGSRDDFFGGYDHATQAGLVHVANHHIAPGKKQWTWGNHEFGYSWDRNLTDSDGPYIELMAGVYTDNQPDFSFLHPGETRTWSQFWYPIQKIGPAQKANVEAALSLIWKNGKVRIGIAVTSRIPGARVRLDRRGSVVAEIRSDLEPSKPFLKEIAVAEKYPLHDLKLSLYTSEGRKIIEYAPALGAESDVPAPATEPLQPAEVKTNEELYLTGLHLEQYRHATRSPRDYWLEALRRDPADSRCNNAMGLYHLRRGEFEQAATHFRNAIGRLTHRNPNPIDGESYYNLGLALRHLQKDEAAYDAFYKATWNYAWQSPAFYALAELDCRLERWDAALEHLDRALRVNVEHLQARNLKAIVLRKLGRISDAEDLLRQTLELDPLDLWAQHLGGGAIDYAQNRLDLALDFSRAGFFREAIELLRQAAPQPDPGTAPLLQYYLADLLDRSGDTAGAKAARAAAKAALPDYCFPARLDEIAIFESAINADATDARARYYLGNLYYDRRLHREAIELWEESCRIDPGFSIVWRNLGIGYANIHKSLEKAAAAYDRALAANPADARLLYERDQLRKRMAEAPADRLAELKERAMLVRTRDDLSVELCALYNQTGQPAKALQVLESRRFQPWEGGEGLALGQYVRAHLALGRRAIKSKDFAKARIHFKASPLSPVNLGESKHLLANQADIHYWLGMACNLGGDADAGRRHWQIAAQSSGDFQEMSVRPFSAKTYYSALALKALGETEQADQLLKDLLAYATDLAGKPAAIDYFATSLPDMLLFEEDLNCRQQIEAKFLIAQAKLGLNDAPLAGALLREILEQDPNHALAADLINGDF
jgi:tetratricopeptide (TPR) repeat protein